MKIYIFEYIEKVSNNWHGGGGVVIIAKNMQEAKKLAEEEDSLEIIESDWEEVLTYRLLYKVNSRIFIFPDAGCC